MTMARKPWVTEERKSVRAFGKPPHTMYTQVDPTKPMPDAAVSNVVKYTRGWKTSSEFNHAVITPSENSKVGHEPIEHFTLTIVRDGKAWKGGNERDLMADIILDKDGFRINTNADENKPPKILQKALAEHLSKFVPALENHPDAQAYARYCKLARNGIKNSELSPDAKKKLVAMLKKE